MGLHSMFDGWPVTESPVHTPFSIYRSGWTIHPVITTNVPWKQGIHWRWVQHSVGAPHPIFTEVRGEIINAPLTRWGVSIPLHRLLQLALHAAGSTGLHVTSSRKDIHPILTWHSDLVHFRKNWLCIQISRQPVLRFVFRFFHHTHSNKDFPKIKRSPTK